MSKGNVEHLTKCILRLNGKGSLSLDIETYIQIYCYGTAQMLCEWLLGKSEHSSEHLAELFVKALPEPLKGLLL